MESTNCLTFTAERVDGLTDIGLYRIGDSLAAVAERIGAAMEIRIGLVCSAEKAGRLDVDKEYMWLTEMNGFEDNFIIWSNTNWNIE